MACCETCRHWDRYDEGTSQMDGECHYDPPQIIVMTETETGPPELIGRWPQTNYESWCSRFASNGEKHPLE
jgi:hypothetical protein